MATGSQLRLARLARRLTLAEVAQRVGIGVHSLSRYENERLPIPPEIEAEIKRVVGWNRIFERFFLELEHDERRRRLWGEGK